MKIALIGANGQLGTDLKKVILAKDMIELNYPEFDITKKIELKTQLTKINPRIIINTAAYNLVDRAEEYPEEALAVNYEGVKNLIEICSELGSTLVHFSTDYVFGADAKRTKPYTEADKPAPLNQYGRSKLLGEQIIQAELKKYFLIRTAYLYGTAGSAGKGTNIIESLIKNGRERGELEVVSDQQINPTYTLDLARQVLKLINTEHYGLYHAAASSSCTVYELAKYIFKCLNQEIAIEPIKLAELSQSAPRPHYSLLINQHLNKLNLNIMRPWPVALKDYLKEKGHLK